MRVLGIVDGTYIGGIILFVLVLFITVQCVLLSVIADSSIDKKPMENSTFLSTS
jgi:hypothetical protein